MTNMTAIQEIRKINLRALITKHGNGEVAKLAGYPSPSFLSQMVGEKSKKVITEKSARRIEAALRLPDYWLDQERDAYGKPVGKPTAVTSFVVEKAPPGPKEALSIVDPDHFADCAYIVFAAMSDRGITLPKAKFSTVVGMLMGSADQSDNALRNLADALVNLSM